MYKTILKAFVFINLLGMTIEASNVLRSVTPKRKLDNIVNTGLIIKCKTYTNNTCICPGTCMSVQEVNNTNQPSCDLHKCWNWDTENSKCIEYGPDYTSAMILQSIPFTGIFGAGLANMGRWDLFAIGSIMWGILSIIPCIIFIVYLLACIQSDPTIIFKRYLWVLLISILSYWIWGIVIISTREVLGPNGCSLIYH